LRIARKARRGVSYPIRRGELFFFRKTFFRLILLPAILRFTN
jgi:hypothetical protein